MRLSRIVNFVVLTLFVKENGYVGQHTLPQIFKTEAEAYSESFLYV